MVAPATISYRDGWFPEEHDGVRPFRWMSREARCGVGGVPADAAAWLRLTVGHAWPRESWPVFSVFVNGRRVGQCSISAGSCDCLFPIAQTGDFDLAFALDRTMTVRGDSRELGIMVRAVQVIDLNREQTLVYGQGWYESEDGEYFRSRWMGLEARVLVPAQLWQRHRFVSLPVWAGDSRQVLTIASGGKVLAELALRERWQVYDVALSAAVESMGGERQPLDLTFRLNTLLADPHASDPRDLGIRVGPLETHDDARRHQKVQDFHRAAPAGGAGEAEDVESAGGAQAPRAPLYLPQDGEGWNTWEFQNYIPFRWAQLQARVTIPERVHQAHRFCSVPIFSEFTDFSQVLTLTANGRTLMDGPLARYWSYYTFDLASPGGGNLELAFRVNKLTPPSSHPGDARELGVRVGPFEFHDDEARRSRNAWAYDNALLNRRELEAGARVLESFPPNLGIDIYAKCNIKPPCVYCWWDHCKSLEGEQVNAVVDDRTLQEYGPFFDAAQTLVNCSFGEPLLHPRLAETLSIIGTRDKVLELATNGQAFTPATVRVLAGQPVLLYISLDAASAEVYGRLRNDRWHDVLAGLIHLRDARRRANGLPTVRMVFIPMRANLCDLEAYFRLSRMVEAEAVVLRPLNYAEHTEIRTERGGYHFDYDRELLTREEIEDVCRRSEQYAGRYGLWLMNQFDFGAPAQSRVHGASGEGDDHGSPTA